MGVKIFIVLEILKMEVGKLRPKFCVHHLQSPENISYLESVWMS
jgi:hypothetical protein